MRMLTRSLTLAAMAVLSAVAISQQKPILHVNKSTLLVVDGLPPTAYKALLKIGLDNRVSIGIVVGKNKSICNASLLHVLSGQRISVATLIEGFDRDVDGYTMTLQDGIINVRAKNISKKGEPLLDVKIPEFSSPPTTMARMGLRLWFSLRAVIAPQEGSAFSGGMSPAAEIISGIQVDGQGVVPILNAIISGGHGGVWVIRDVSLAPDAGLPFEVHSYVGEDEIIRQLSLC